jgi:hypothetical protein
MPVRIRELAALTMILAATGALAREPGLASQTPPGLTIGLPIAMVPPPGLYWTMRTSVNSADLVDGKGHFFGERFTIYGISNQLTWVPGWTLLGGKYKAFVTVPMIDIDMNHSVGAPHGPAGPLGRFSQFGIANPKVQPFDLAWSLGGGWNIEASVGFYAPISSYKKTDKIKIGADFWTLEPGIGVTYLKDDWHLSLHAVYNTNSENASTKYRSGDQVFLNGTLTRKVFDDWSVGPVAYYQQQITSDTNNGMAYGPKKPTFGSQKEFAVGALVGHQFGPVNATLFYTNDVVAEGTTKSSKVWLNFAYKLY